MHTVAIILAAGSGSRMGGKTKKQYMQLQGHTILYYSIRAFQESPVDDIVLVTSKEDVEEVSDIYGAEFDKIRCVVPGGRERYNSVYSGLKAASAFFEGCEDKERYVLIHDGARPFVNNEIIKRCLEGVAAYKAVVAAMPSKDTVKIADENGVVISTPDRRSVWIMQTPQCFEYPLIYKAYTDLITAEEDGSLGNLHITDDAQVCEYYSGHEIRLVEGSYNNIKITTPEDMTVGNAIIKSI